MKKVNKKAKEEVGNEIGVHIIFASEAFEMVEEMISVHERECSVVTR